jgi:Spy/CpxP family protein refolding chaperone
MSIHRLAQKLFFIVLLTGVAARAEQPGDGQEPPPPGAPPDGAPQMHIGPPPPPMQPNRPPIERSFRLRPPGRWWTDPETVKDLGLTTDQQKRMDDLFQQSRLKLIDLNAALQKQEVILQPLLGADQPNESQILSQIDKVAQARAELEKANARMLLGLRSVLTLDQWKKLQAERRTPRDGFRRNGNEGRPRDGGFRPPQPPNGQ